MSKKLRHALIGCGGCGVGKHLTSYAKFPQDVELAAVFDIDLKRAKNAAEMFKVTKVCSSREELLADKTIDMVSVATPTGTHAEIAVACLKAGKHVHVEKPMAINAQQAQQMVDAKNASGKKLMVGLNNRFTEISTFIKRYVDHGHLGEIYHARCGWRRRRGIPISGWFNNKALGGGGPLIDLGVHYMDLTLFFMGFPRPASVMAQSVCKFGNSPKLVGQGKPEGIYDVEDFAAGFVRLENEATVAFEFSWASNIPEELQYCELLGDKGGLSLSYAPSGSQFKILTESDGELVDLCPQVRNTTGWGENETKHFIECIKKDKTPLSIPEEAVQMMKLIGAVYESAEKRKEVVIAQNKSAKKK